MMSELQKKTRLQAFKLRKILRNARNAIRNALLAPEKNFRFYLKYKFKVDKPSGYPEAPWRNAVLGTQQEWENAAKQVETLGLPQRSDLPKNWDTLAALDCILRRTDSEARILDAGAELYSYILPWLYLYGYKHLIGINIVFNGPFRRGPILYEHGDITHTQFKENRFDVITCLSVIEHGVNLRSYFQEASRILKPGGVLITSTDYYSEPIDTRNHLAYGVPIHIFTKDEIIQALNLAKELGLELIDSINLDCQEKPIRWEEFDLDYTFLVFTLQKVIPTSS
jgi:SAM-dependent methyltransferase